MIEPNCDLCRVFLLNFVDSFQRSWPTLFTSKDITLHKQSSYWSHKTKEGSVCTKVLLHVCYPLGNASFGFGCVGNWPHTEEEFITVTLISYCWRSRTSHCYCVSDEDIWFFPLRIFSVSLCGSWNVFGSFLHVNIFQHIGLSRFSEKNRPALINHMPHTCLNLRQTQILSAVFGHSIVDCHVEHHLVPKLSDNMCLELRPVVTQFLKDNSLPYHEDTYVGRLKYLLEKFETLMMDAPQITHHVGIQ